MINIEKEVVSGVPLFRLGFRPFFLGAGVFAVISILIWSAFYIFQIELPFLGLPSMLWHAHEMIFGYGMAVIAGFLLTAIKNWTGQQTLKGRGLAILFMLWLIARILPFTGQYLNIPLYASIDLAFMVLLFVAAAKPIIKVRQYTQTGILAKLLLLFLSNVVFYLGVLGVLEEGINWGLYSGLYMILALLMVMARRVIPFFIERGIAGDVKLKNWKSVDLLSLILLFLLWIVDVFTSYTTLMSGVAGALFIIHVIRMAGWYTSKIWRVPLLWVLYLAYASIVFGFALKFLQLWLDISPFLAVHAFAYGGVGVMTLGMMSRVILGHTGRDISSPPSMVFWCFLLLLLGAVARVILPLFSMAMYTHWIAISQLLWLLAFCLFLYIYLPMLITPRIDGRDG